MPNEALDAVIAAQKLSDDVYALFVDELGSTMEQAEIASRDRQIMKQFSYSAGGAVLKFQNKPVMRADKGEPIKAYLKATKLDFLLPAPTPDPIKQLEIPPDVLAAAKIGNMTARATMFKLVHGDKSKTQEAESLAKVEALIAGEKIETPAADQITDDRARRAARAADTTRENNPWSAGNWNVTKQGELIKALGLAAAAGIARAANSHIGATRPTKAA